MKMTKGFRMSANVCLAEIESEPPSAARLKKNAKLAEKDKEGVSDGRMVPMTRIHESDYKNEKVKEFMKRQKEDKNNRILTHNLHNLQMGAVMLDNPESDEVIDKLMNQQVERTINGDLRRTKKGTFEYLKRETADMKRVKAYYAGIRSKQKLALLDKK